MCDRCIELYEKLLLLHEQAAVLTWEKVNALRKEKADLLGQVDHYSDMLAEKVSKP